MLTKKKKKKIFSILNENNINIDPTDIPNLETTYRYENEDYEYFWTDLNNFTGRDIYEHSHNDNKKDNNHIHEGKGDQHHIDVIHVNNNKTDIDLLLKEINELKNSLKGEKNTKLKEQQDLIMIQLIELKKKLEKEKTIDDNKTAESEINVIKKELGDILILLNKGKDNKYDDTNIINIIKKSNDQYIKSIEERNLLTQKQLLELNKKLEEIQKGGDNNKNQELLIKLISEQKTQLDLLAQEREKLKEREREIKEREEEERRKREEQKRLDYEKLLQRQEDKFLQMMEQQNKLRQKLLLEQAEKLRAMEESRITQLEEDRIKREVEEKNRIERERIRQEKLQMLEDLRQKKFDEYRRKEEERLRIKEEERLRRIEEERIKREIVFQKKLEEERKRKLELEEMRLRAESRAKEIEEEKKIEEERLKKLYEEKLEQYNEERIRNQLELDRLNQERIERLRILEEKERTKIKEYRLREEERLRILEERIKRENEKEKARLQKEIDLRLIEINKTEEMLRVLISQGLPTQGGLSKEELIILLNQQKIQLENLINDGIGDIKVIKGKDGSDGRDGEDGIDGRDGERGNDGRDGEEGERGNNGKDGEEGERGIDGKNGDRGERGEKGEQGKVTINPDPIDSNNGEDNNKRYIIETTEGVKVRPTEYLYNVQFGNTKLPETLGSESLYTIIPKNNRNSNLNTNTNFIRRNMISRSNRRVNRISS